MESAAKMDDFGVPPFYEPTKVYVFFLGLYLISWNIHRNISRRTSSVDGAAQSCITHLGWLKPKQNNGINHLSTGAAPSFHSPHPPSPPSPPRSRQLAPVYCTSRTRWRSWPTKRGTGSAVAGRVSEWGSAGGLLDDHLHFRCSKMAGLDRL